MENRPSINDFPTFNLHFEGCSPYINLHIFRTMAVSQAKDVWYPVPTIPTAQLRGALPVRAWRKVQPVLCDPKMSGHRLGSKGRLVRIRKPIGIERAGSICKYMYK
jgi:hypothetical protein